MSKKAFFIFLFCLLNIYLVSAQVLAEPVKVYGTDFQVIDHPPGSLEYVLSRLKVPGGWLVMYETNSRHDLKPVKCTMTFLPDPKHEWKVDNEFIRSLKK